MRKSWIWRCAVAVFVVAPAAGQSLSEFLPERMDAISCWQRVYDAEHLAAHPDQLVTAISFGMSRADWGDTADNAQFGIAVTLRGGLTGSATGPCTQSDEGVRCGVECDGGGFWLDARADDRVLLDLEVDGYIRLQSECAGGSEEESFSLEAGRDDRQFLLARTDEKVCRAIVPRE